MATKPVPAKKAAIKTVAKKTMPKPAEVKSVKTRSTKEILEQLAEKMVSELK